MGYTIEDLKAAQREREIIEAHKRLKGLEG